MAAKKITVVKQGELTRELFYAARTLEQESKKRGGAPLTRRQISSGLSVTNEVAKSIETLLQYGKYVTPASEETAVSAAITQKALIISDLHIPYHDDEAIETALSAGEKAKVDTVVLLGDILDFYKISSFSKDPRRKSVNLEMEEGKAFLSELRKRFPKARIIYYRGNHEMRLEKYICDKATELVDMLEELMQNKLGFRELNIEYHTDPFRLGKLWLMHGHEKPGGYGAEHIPNVIEKYVRDHCLVGHYHRTQSKVYKRIDGSRYWIGALGYLGGPQDYAPLNQWGQGFAIIEFDEVGRFMPRLYEIVEGRIY